MYQPLPWRKFLVLTSVGEVLFLLLCPEEVKTQGRVLFLATWPLVAAWLTELLPLGITALLFPVVGTLSGVVPAGDAFAPFAHPVIFLFLGSFLVARAVEKTGTAEWLVYRVLTRPRVPLSLYRLTYLFGLTVFGLSMWLSNTATVAAVLPIIPSLTRVVPADHRKSLRIFLLLLTAYAANIGGIATPVGTPPNLIALGLVEKMAQSQPLSFVQWVLVALPPSLMLFTLAHGILYWRYLRYFTGTLTLSDLQVPPAGRGILNTLYAFGLLVVLWFVPGLIRITFPQAPLSRWLAVHWPEAVPALIIAIVLYFLPDEDTRSILTSHDLRQIDWNTLLLFGGGLSFGFMAKQTELLDDLVRGVLHHHQLPSFLFILVVTSLAVFATEVFSNTAMANLLIPVVIALARTSSRGLWSPVLGVAFGCSMAFMLPIATPPNAMVFGAGGLTIRDMMKNGAILNVLSILVITLTVLFIVPVVTSS